MKKVLIISYAFPPVGGGGVQRSVKFVKFLKEFNWEPLVLTVANPSVPLVDINLTKDIPDGTKIYKARTYEPSYSAKKNYSKNIDSKRSKLINIVKRLLFNMLLPDVQVLWWPGLALTLVSVLKKEKPDCIFVSAPPFSTFIPVVIIGNFFKIPVVLDYRDEWDYSRSQLENLSKSKIAKKLDYFLEKYCITHCSAFTTATDSYKHNLTDKYNLKNPHLGVCITNGYDETDLINIDRRSKKSDNIIRVVFSGTVWKGTSLRIFFSAIEHLLEVAPEAKEKLKVCIFGRIVESEMKYCRTDILKNIVEIAGYVEHNHIIHEIFNADILLLSITEAPGAERIILGKIFEYMATGNHILALLPTGESEHLLRKNYGNVTIVNPGDKDKISQAMLRLMTNIDAIREAKSPDISSFSRRNLTEKLSHVFNQVVSN